MSGTQNDLFLKVPGPSKQGLNSKQKKGHERVPDKPNSGYSSSVYRGSETSQIYGDNRMRF